MQMKARYILLVICCLLSLGLLLTNWGGGKDIPPDDQLPSNRIKSDQREKESEDVIEEEAVGKPYSNEDDQHHRHDDTPSGQDILKLQLHPLRDGKERRHALPSGKLSELNHSKSKIGQSCLARENVTFIKAHKTGSSTVQNIFLRYGDKHDLAFVLPPAGHHLGYPAYFERKHMLHNEKDVYNVFCHHARFSQRIPQVMPPNTVYITIVRDPVKVFESSFTYFKMDYRLGMTNDPEALDKFLQNAPAYYEAATNKVHMKNPMLFDLGLDVEDFKSEALLKKAIKTFHKRFSLVMVAEYFEESLILMRDLLCWTTEDVVVFKLNTRKDDSIVSLSEKTKKDINEWNNGDVLLYEHFNRTMQQKIESYGRDRMATEVSLLQERTRVLYEKCIETDHANKDEGHFKVWQPFGVHINAFVLRADQTGNKACERMIMPEIQYTKDLRKKQFPDLKQPDPALMRNRRRAHGKRLH